MNRHEPGPLMDLANMRKQGVTRLIAYCLNDACRHQALIEVWSYPANTEIAYSNVESSVPSVVLAETRLTCVQTGRKRHRFKIGAAPTLGRVTSDAGETGAFS